MQSWRGPHLPRAGKHRSTGKEGDRLVLRGGRRQRTVVLVVLLVLAAFAAPAAPLWAADALAAGEAEATGGGTVGRGAGVSLEQAIAAVKRLVEIPEEFSEFSPGYSEDEGGRSFWQLNWSSPSSDGGSVYARVNAATGEVWSLNIWTPDGGSAFRRGLPKLSYAQAKEAAQAFLKRALPAYADQLRYLEPVRLPTPYLSLQARGPLTYYYTFVRLVNGLPFFENQASVEVDADTGQVRSFHFNWDEKAEFPSSAGVIPKDKAVSLWRANAGVELIYYRPDLPADQEPPLQLVYAPARRSVMIDALTGEVLPAEQDYFVPLFDFAAGGGERSQASLKAEPVALTPAEEKAVGEMEKLLSREEALARVKEKISLPAEFELGGASLDRDWRLPDIRRWSFSWRHKENSGYLNVRVDARSGLIVGYELTYYDPPAQRTPRLDEARARELAEAFLTKLAGQYRSALRQPKVVPLYDSYLRPAGEAAKPTGYGFEYVRLVNGLPFPSNGVKIFVDALREQVTNYSLEWWDLNFPAPAEVIDRTRAEDVFLSAGLVLGYKREPLPPVKGYVRPEDRPVRLVYLLDQERAPYLVDAKTGAGLDANLEPKRQEGTPSFTDLGGHPAREAVEALAAVGIIPAGPATFAPDQPLSQRDFLVWLVRACGWRPGSELKKLAVVTPAAEDREFRQALEYARRAGILRRGEEYLPQETVTLRTVVRLAVRALGWGEVAELGGIWKLPAAAAIAPEEEGYFALAAKLGLVDVAAKDFTPQARLTRGDGAIALYRLLRPHQP